MLYLHENLIERFINGFLGVCKYCTGLLDWTCFILTADSTVVEKLAIYLSTGYLGWMYYIYVAMFIAYTESKTYYTLDAEVHTLKFTPLANNYACGMWY